MHQQPVAPYFTVKIEYFSNFLLLEYLSWSETIFLKKYFLNLSHRIVSVEDLIRNICFKA